MPVLVINYKLYNETLGENGKKIAEHAKKISDRLGVNIVIAPAFPDIRLLSGIVPVVAQHIDPLEPGAHTGSVTAEAVKKAGAVGTMINHSERTLDPKTVEQCILRAKQNDLMTICCADSLENAVLFAKFSPDYIMIELPGLIGGNSSIAKTNPQIISQTVSLVKSVNPAVGVICGAGVSTGEDAMIARKLGAIGVAAASAIAKAKNPERVIEDIVNGLL